MVAAFLKQKRREARVSHLPPYTHDSVKLSLLSSPSSSFLFSEDLIKESLTQVKENSQFKLLANLSSFRGGKQSAQLLPPRVELGFHPLIGEVTQGVVGVLNPLSPLPFLDRIR